MQMRNQNMYEKLKLSLKQKGIYKNFSCSHTIIRIHQSIRWLLINYGETRGHFLKQFSFKYKVVQVRCFLGKKALLISYTTVT